MADVARRIEFNIDTARLGPIHCGSLKVKAVSELRRLRKGFVHAPRDFTCLLLSKVGTRPNPNPADRTLTISLEEAASLSDAELNVFASRFLEGNSWLKNSVEDNGSTNAAPETAMAAMEQLAECFEERTGKLAAWLRGFGWLVSTASDFEAGDAITKVPGSAGFGERSLELAGRLARQKAKLWLAARTSIEAMEQVQRTLSSSEIAIGSNHEREPSSVDLLEVPIDTIYETNRRLDELIESAKQFRETANEWTNTVLEDFAEKAKQSVRRNRLIIAAAFFVLGPCVIVLFYLQRQTTSAQLANQAMITGMAKTEADQSAWMKRSATSYADQNAKIIGLFNAYVNRSQTSNRQIVDAPHLKTSIQKSETRFGAFTQKTRAHRAVR